MSFYKKIPVLDEKEQAEFDKYLKEQYAQDLKLAWSITLQGLVTGMTSQQHTSVWLAVFDKLATPRIYLLQAWLHRRAQEAAGVLAKGQATENAEEFAKNE